MNIAFLKTLMGETFGKSALPHATGTVPAFPEDMVFDDDISGEMPNPLPNPLDVQYPAQAPVVEEVLPVNTDGENPPLLEGGLTAEYLEAHSGTEMDALEDIQQPEKLVNNILASSGTSISSHTGASNSSNDSPIGRAKPIVNVVNSTPVSTADADMPDPITLRPAQDLTAKADVNKSQEQPSLRDRRIDRSAPQAADKIQTPISEPMRQQITAGAAEFTETPLPNMPLSLRENMKQIHVMPNRNGTSRMTDVDAAKVQTRPVEPPLADEISTDDGKNRPEAALLSALRTRRVWSHDSGSPVSTIQIKNISLPAQNTLTTDIRPTASAVSDVTLDLDANFIDNLSREIGIIAQSKGIARFSLRPEHLGRIDVEIRGGEQGDEIKLTAETETVRQLLLQSQSRLEQDVRLQGHRLGGVEIETNADQSQERGAQDSAQGAGQKTRESDNHDANTDHSQPRGMAGQADKGARYA